MPHKTVELTNNMITAMNAMLSPALAKRLILGALALAGLGAQAAVITFDGSSIGSSGLGLREPFFNQFYTFVYVDGLNHAPRVDPSSYAGSWVAGQHAGTGVSVSGWSSLNNGTPGRYAFDIEGLSLQNETMVTSGARYGHNDRTYVGGTWSLIDLVDHLTVASGTVGTTAMDVNYAGIDVPVGMTGSSLLTVTDDGGAFYNELGVKSLLMTFSCYDSPGVYTMNDLPNAWAVYPNAHTSLETVPEPATLTIGAAGLAALLGWRAASRKKRA